MLKFTFRKIKQRLRRVRVLARAQRLEKWMLGKQFAVYNGKTYHIVEVVRLRLGQKAGAFVFTRKAPVHKGKKRK